MRLRAGRGGIERGSARVSSVEEIFDGAEGATMLGAGAKVAKGGLVGGGAVADVFLETVAGIFCGEFGHIAVAGDFGNDRGGGNFLDEEIGLLEQGDLAGERGVGEEVDGAVDDDFVEFEGVFFAGGEDLLDGTASGEF